MDLFNPNLGADLKAAGMATVEDHADEDFKAIAPKVLFLTAKELPFLTTDDVMARMPEGVTTHNYKALGPIMRAGAKALWIEKADMPWVPCLRPSRHHAPMQPWRSL